MIIVGYVRFRLKLNLEAILESKAILLQKICSGHQNERIALRLCQPKFVKKLDCRFFFFFFISCNILIGSVTCVAGKFVTWASFTSSLKLQVHPRQLPWLRTANILLTRRTKPAQHGENQNPPVSIRGQQSHPRSKVPPRLLKTNQESLSPFLFRRKLKNLKAMFSLIWTSKEVKENAFARKLTSWAQRDTTSGKHHKLFRCWDTLDKNKGPKSLVEPQERALRFERGQRKCSCIRGQIMPTRNSKTRGNQ